MSLNYVDEECVNNSNLHKLHGTKQDGNKIHRQEFILLHEALLHHLIYWYNKDR